MPDCTHLEFVSTPEFIDSVDDLLTAADVRALEGVLLDNPEAGALVREQEA